MGIERLRSFPRDQLNKSHGGHVGVPDKRGKRLFRWPQSDKTWQSNGFTNTDPIPNINSNPNPKLLTLTLTQPYSKFVSKPILKKKVLTKCHSELGEITFSTKELNFFWKDLYLFDLDKSRQKFHHSLKEHHKISNIPKFRCEML
jgi:hypothetical protein